MGQTFAQRCGMRFRNTFIGDRPFYRSVLALVLPIVAQNTITHLVNLLDNLMVGQLGTAQLSAVAISNQMIFVYNLAIFGALSGAGIYGAQFAGAKNWEGLRHTYRFKFVVSIAIAVSSVLLLFLAAESLLSLFLTGDGAPGEAAATLQYGRQYLHIMLWGLIPFAIKQSYASTLRETGNTFLPMIASIAAVLTNLVLNYILIFGHLGFPALGIRGAAIATSISRFVELGIVAGWTHARRVKYFFMDGVYRSLRIGRKLAAGIARKSLPLLINELLWAMSVTALMQIYSTRGLNVVAGMNIASTFANLFNVFFLSMGMAVAVFVGQALGANDINRARNLVWKLIFFSVSVNVFLASMLFASSGFIPRFYNTEDTVRHLATVFMRTSALYMAFNGVAHCCYFTLRSGGKTFITFLFDSVYSWGVIVPVAFLLVKFTGLSITTIFPMTGLADALKSVVGVLLVRTGYWAKNLVSAKDVSDAAEETASA